MRRGSSECLGPTGRTWHLASHSEAPRGQVACPRVFCPAHLRFSRLQGHHPREHSHRQPGGAQQPLHPHRPSEQLLSSAGLASGPPLPCLTAVH